MTSETLEKTAAGMASKSKGKQLPAQSDGRPPKKPTMSVAGLALTLAGAIAAFAALHFQTQQPHEEIVKDVSKTWWYQASGWMNRHWEIPAITAAAYVCLVHLGQRWMATRDPLPLGRILVAWNFFLAGFSIVGACAVIPVQLGKMWTSGALGEICSNDEEMYTPWVMFFCLSKFPELVDTAFLILRKRPVILLHWYHHALTLIYCWWGWSVQGGSGGAFGAMNLFVHSIMYTYYGIMSAKYSISPRISKLITTMQISQMFFGLAACLGGLSCGDSAQFWFNVGGSVMYFSYALLFIQMYRQKYSKAKRT